MLNSRLNVYRTLSTGKKVLVGTLAENRDGSYSTDQTAVGDKLMVKLTSDKFDLKHSESLVEYLYMDIARKIWSMAILFSMN